jgi:hypothetical protein
MRIVVQHGNLGIIIQFLATLFVEGFSGEGGQVSA